MSSVKARDPLIARVQDLFARGGDLVSRISRSGDNPRAVQLADQLAAFRVEIDDARGSAYPRQQLTSIAGQLQEVIDSFDGQPPAPEAEPAPAPVMPAIPDQVKAMRGLQDHIKPLPDDLDDDTWLDYKAIGTLCDVTPHSVALWAKQAQMQIRPITARGGTRHTIRVGDIRAYLQARLAGTASKPGPKPKAPKPPAKLPAAAQAVTVTVHDPESPAPPAIMALPADLLERNRAWHPEKPTRQWQLTSS